MKKIADTKSLSREEWLALRKSGIGGSDAGAICGLNKYVSPIDVFMDKTNLQLVKEEQNEAMRLGSDLEEYVAKRWEEATGKKVRKNNFMLQHDEYDFMLANIDREVVGEKAILECKTASPYSADHWKDASIPPHYVIQCLHYMAVTGVEKCYLACLIYGRGVEFREIERDENAINNLIQLEKNFWEEYVVKDKMPPADGSKAADEAIKEKYAESSPGAEVEIDGIDLKRYDEITQLIASMEREKKQIEQNIKLQMEEAEIGWIGDRKVTWKTCKGRTTLDSKRLEKEHPAIYTQYSKVGKPSRRFSIDKRAEA